MKPSQHQRRGRRQACEAAIEWMYFNQGEFQGAVKRNDGRQGFYFESPSCPKINASIFVKPRSGHGTGKSGAPQVRTTALARVKWIKVIKSGDDPLYGIGAEYYDSPLDPFF